MSTFDPAALEVARELIPWRARKWLYLGTSLVSLALTATAIGLGTLGAPIPDAIPTALAIIGVLTGPLGQLAGANVTPPAAVTAPVALTIDDGPAVELPDGGFAPDPEDETEPVAEPDPATAV